MLNKFFIFRVVGVGYLQFLFLFFKKILSILATKNLVFKLQFSKNFLNAFPKIHPVFNNFLNAL